MRTKILGNKADTSKDDLFSISLDEAKSIALNTLYPFHDIDEIPERYKMWQIRCAIELYQKLGDEGIVKYSENYLSYEYGENLISKDLKNELKPPRAGVIY